MRHIEFLYGGVCIIMIHYTAHSPVEPILLQIAKQIITDILSRYPQATQTTQYLQLQL